MTKRLGSFVAVCLASSLAACALLLDFDELQTDGQDASLGGTDGGLGGTSSGGTGGGSGSAGDAATDGGGTGGDASAPECVNPSDCDDQDPLTSDDCVSARCVYAPVGTLELDLDFKLDQLTPQALRVTLATFGDRVVLSTFAAGTNVPHQTKLHTFAVAAQSATFDASTDVPTLLSGLPDGGVSDETPGSAVGLLEVAGELHAFFATFKPFSHTKVWHVSLDANLAPTTAATVITDPGLSYDVGLGQSRQYPTPGIVNDGDVAAAYVLGPGSASPNGVELRGPNGKYGTFAVGAVYGAPVSVPGGAGVAFLKSGSSNYGWRVSGTTQEYSACFQSATSWGPLSVTSPVPGLTFGVYSSSHLGVHRTDSRAFFCNATGCLVTPSDAASCVTSSTEFVRNPVIHAQLTNAQPKQGVRVRLASVYPAVNGTKTDLLLNVGFADIADEGSSGGYPVVTVQSDTGAPSTTADYPAVLVVGDRIVVAWISGAPGSEVVHLRRYTLVPGQ